SRRAAAGGLLGGWRCVVRIASFNVESLFERPVAMNQKTWADGKQVLEWVTQLNGILNKDVYTGQDKSDSLDLLKNLEPDNDDRGIDVGLMSRSGYEIERVRSHVDDSDAHGLIFSRDCPEYTITTPAGKRLLLLVNHLKSKGFGSTASNNARRLRQATRVAEIYTRQRQNGEKNIVVLGDFNDSPDSAQLQPLLAGTDHKDISQ